MPAKPTVSLASIILSFLNTTLESVQRGTKFLYSATLDTRSYNCCWEYLRGGTRRGTGDVRSGPPPKCKKSF